MTQKQFVYVIFFVLLFGGYFLYVFNDSDFSQSSLPVINNNIGSFSFINQDGKNISDKDYEGKVYVAEYFFTTCKGICPRMNANMRRVYDEYKNETNFAILSHTCMPETDSVPLLKQYQYNMMLGKLIKNDDGRYTIEKPTTPFNIPFINNTTNWNFVTGDKTELYNIARHGYLIDNNNPDSLQNIGNQFLHSQFFALVDKQSRVRGIYDGLKEDEIQKLIKNIKELLNEKFQTRSLKGF